MTTDRPPHPVTRLDDSSGARAEFALPRADLAAPSTYSRRELLLLAVAVAALAVALYGRTLQFGWHWDDYHQVRPYTAADVAASFHGSWDPHGPEASFYRPLTVTWFALRFQLFGFAAPAYHATSLLLLAGCAFLAGLLAARLTDSPGAGVAAAVLLLLHPVTPDALAVWPANQPHLFALVIALASANWVLLREPATYSQWLPGLVAVCLSLGFKEDGLALLFWLPAVLAARQRRWPRLRFVLVLLATAALLVVARGLLLGELGGYTSKQLSLTQLIAHTLRGPASVLALGVGTGFQLLQLAFPPGDRSAFTVTATLAEYVVHYAAIATLAVGGIAARRNPALIAGLAALVFFNAPLIWQSKSTGWHHFVLASVLIFAAAGSGVTREIRVAGGPWVARLYVALLAALLLPVNIAATSSYHPCAGRVRAQDNGSDVQGWIEQGLVSEPMRAYLDRKREACSTAP